MRPSTGMSGNEDGILNRLMSTRKQLENDEAVERIVQSDIPRDKIVLSRAQVGGLRFGLMVYRGRGWSWVH